MSNIKVQIRNNSDDWCIDNDGKFRKIVYEELINDMAEENADKIFNNANNILRKCPNPSTTKKGQNTGIVIGKVQSGKTSNFISLVALAFDNKYDIAVVLGGNKNNLVNQNAERIGLYFRNTSDVVVLSTTENKDILKTNEL